MIDRSDRLEHSREREHDDAAERTGVVTDRSNNLPLLLFPAARRAITAVHYLRLSAYFADEAQDFARSRVCVRVFNDINAVCARACACRRSIAGRTTSPAAYVLIRAAMPVSPFSRHKVRTADDGPYDMV